MTLKVVIYAYKMNNTILMNNKIAISYAFKDLSVDGKKSRHGDQVERKLAESAKRIIC